MRHIFLACILIILASGCRRSVGVSAEETLAVPESFTPEEEAEVWAQDMFFRMTPEERAAQLMMPALYSKADDATIKRLKWYAEELRVGGLLLLQGDASSVSAIADTLYSIRDRIPRAPGTFLAIDAETGLGMRLSDAPKFPWNNRIDRQADSTVFFDYGQEVGRESRLLGINMILGPVVDISRIENPAENVMKKRSLGSDQLRVARLSSAYISGLQSQGIAGVVKHFPGHGPTATDSHKNMPAVKLPEEELFAVDLFPFRKAIEAGVDGIMVGHIWAQALDSVVRPASFSPVIINGLLRDRMGFEGLVLVDAVNMAGAEGYTVVDAINAGADIIIAPIDTEKAIDDIMLALDERTLSKERLEESVMRILCLKYMMHLHEAVRPDATLDPNDIKECLRQEALPVISRLKKSE